MKSKEPTTPDTYGTMGLVLGLWYIRRLSSML